VYFSTACRTLYVPTSAHGCLALGQDDGDGVSNKGEKGIYH
jgi:hypothetical protein